MYYYNIYDEQILVVDVVVLYEHGGGTGPILLDDVDCTGDESSLSQCYHDGIGNHDCIHTEDVGVRCGEKSFVFKFHNITNPRTHARGLL